MNIVTADQAIADGTTPAALLSVARGAGRQESQELRRVAREVAARTGVAYRIAANDNARRGNGARARRAA